MRLILERSEWAADGVFGRLRLEDGTEFRTLEHAYDDGAGGWVAKLNEGTHICQRGTHSLHNSIPFSAFEITGVPGHTGILFHKGNYNKDSEGCVLVGMKIVPNGSEGRMLFQSASAFNQFMEALDGIDEFELEVRG